MTFTLKTFIWADHFVRVFVFVGFFFFFTGDYLLTGKRPRITGRRELTWKAKRRSIFWSLNTKLRKELISDGKREEKVCKRNEARFVLLLAVSVQGHSHEKSLPQ